MTIKELCTKVREAAERALAEDNQGALSGPNYSRFENLYPDTGAHHRTANPPAVLALLGRIEELEKAARDARETLMMVTDCFGSQMTEPFLKRVVMSKRSLADAIDGDAP